MDEEDLGTGIVTVELNDQDFSRRVDRMAQQMERTLDRASERAGRAIEQNVQAGIDRIDRNVVVDVTYDVDRSELDQSVDSVVQRVTVDVDRRGQIGALGLEQALDSVQTAARAAGSALSGMLGVVSSLPVVLPAAIGVVTALAAELTPLVGILAAAPAAILGFNAALATLQLATLGASDAFESALSDSAEDFAEVIENLSPALQGVAREVRSLRPEFEELRDSVQEGFWSQFEGQITAAADALGGPLNSGLTSIGETMGNVVSEFLTFLSTDRAIQDITAIPNATAVVIDGLGQGAVAVAEGFLDIGAAVAEAFGDDLSETLAGIGERFGEFLTNAAASGDAVAWVTEAVDLFKQLGEILIGVVASFTTDTGEGTLLDSIQRFVESGQLTTLIEDLAEFGRQITPVLGDLAQFVILLAPGLIAFGEFVTGIVGGIQELIGWFSDFEVDIGEWGDNFADQIEQTRDTVIALFQQMAVQGLSWLSRLRNDGIAFVQSMGRRLVELVQSASGAVTGALSNLVSRARGTLAGLPAAAVSAGAALVAGLIRSISGGAGRVAGAIGAMVSAAIARARDVLGIASPSKVFATIGDQTIQGYIRGVDRMTPAAERTMARSSRSMISSFEAGRPLTAPAVVTGSMAPVRLSAGLAPVGSPFGPGGLSQARSGASGGVTFNITEVGDAETTAQRVLTRLTAAAAVI